MEPILAPENSDFAVTPELLSEADGAAGAIWTTDELLLSLLKMWDMVRCC